MTTRTWGQVSGLSLKHNDVLLRVISRLGDGGDPTTTRTKAITESTSKERGAMSTARLTGLPKRKAPPVGATWQRTTTTRELVIVGERAEALWEMYTDAFTPLETLAIQRHLWSRKEVLSELASEEIVKFVGWSGEVPVGLCMLTNNLDLVPMISPAFLRDRFPEHAARNAIFYGIMIFVRRGFRGKTMFARLGTQMAQETAVHAGVVLFDMCAFNRENGSLGDNLGKLARPFAGSAMSLVDQQSWFAVELPKPLEHGAGFLRNAS
jgi:hypothetical protein